MSRSNKRADTTETCHFQFYLKRVDEYQYELDHLQGCEISFPAEIFLNAGPPGGEEVVEVHHTVHPGVEEGAKPTLTSSDKPGAPPAEPGQSPVVDDVERGEVGELLPGNKEHGVGQVNKLIKNNHGHSSTQQGCFWSCLGKEIPPGEVESPLGHRAVRVVHRLTDPVVLSGHVEAPALQEHPETKDGLEEIVGQHETPDLIRLPILHEPEGVVSMYFV